MIKFDYSKCSKCHNCISVCPFAIIVTKDGFPTLDSEKSCFKCYHCLISCPNDTISCGHTHSQYSNKDFLNDDFREQLSSLVVNRRSIRHYQDTPYPHYKLEAILETVRMSPSAKNQQAVKWVVVSGKDKTQKIMNLVFKWLDETGNYPELKKMYEESLNLVTLNAPNLLFAYAKEDSISPELDCTIALTTAEILLQADGAGTCHAGYLRRISNADEELKKYLGIPDGCQVYGVLTLGYAYHDDYMKIPYRKEPEITWI